MVKKGPYEADVCRIFVTPAIKDAGWDLRKQVREQFPVTKGRKIIDGKLIREGKKIKPDYILYYKSNLPIAVVEAKHPSQSIGSGMQQALNYADILDLPFAYSSNGKAFIEHDKTISKEKEIPLNKFPSPNELWQRYKVWKGLDEEKERINTTDYYYEQGGKKPRYYQTIAINKTIEAISNGQNRLLLVMATGTGKTFVAFQIIYRLWKAKQKKRILYLADRNVLIDQTMVNDFKSFGSVMTKIKNRNTDKSYEIYMALYQGISGNEDWKNIYKQFSPNFFDLIVVDECHRGSAAVDSAWREILEYYSSATQIGMTATPKETKEVSNIDYFGEPIYKYSLKQGIEDGFLAPYRVIRIDLDKDEGWRPTYGKLDKYENLIPDRIYNVKDHDRSMVIDKRTAMVAQKVSQFLKNTNRFDKTIIFCVDIEHAERMRMALVNENADLYSKNQKYIMRITGDNAEGKNQLDNFIDPATKHPVIVTTSKLMTTGVDTQTCKLIVLDSNIQSMTEFKQIIGRGTRVNEAYNKHFFTIMDFRKVTDLFADPDFDGEPVQIYEPSVTDEIKPPRIMSEDTDISIDDEPEKIKKYYVNDIPVQVLRERVQYYSEGGKLITESLKDYTRKNVKKEYTSIDKFLTKWKEADKKTAILKELIDQGVLLSELKQEVGKEYDEFDLICHIAFDQKPLTRTERANNVKKRNYFAKYGEKSRKVIEALINKYEDVGIENIEDLKILKVRPFNTFGTPVEILNSFGGKDSFLNALIELEQELYAEV
ncbi:EcoAI/FtnUII family type I restriction enzme subunit R [Halobacteriota archaeon]